MTAQQDFINSAAPGAQTYTDGPPLLNRATVSSEMSAVPSESEAPTARMNGSRAGLLMLPAPPPT